MVAPDTVEEYLQQKERKKERKDAKAATSL